MESESPTLNFYMMDIGSWIKDIEGHWMLKNRYDGFHILQIFLHLILIVILILMNSFVNEYLDSRFDVNS